MGWSIQCNRPDCKEYTWASNIVDLIDNHANSQGWFFITTIIMNSDELQVDNYLRKKGFRPERFLKKEQRKNKTPDFRVFKGNDLLFFCEVKSIEKDNWIENQPKIKIDEGMFISGGLRQNPIYNRLTNDIHESIRQFDAVNPNLEYPNVLVFVNHDNSCELNYLQSVYTGCFINEDGKLDDIYKQFSDGRIREEKLRIHLFIWFEDNRPNEYFRFTYTKEVHHKTLCKYFGIDPNMIKKTP